MGAAWLRAVHGLRYHPAGDAGRALTLEDLQQVREPVAALLIELPQREIAGLFDTVYVSLYKGLEGVRGAVLAGDDETIGHAEVWRQRLGGALPDAWPFAVAAMIGLDEVLPRMPAFRDHAVAIAKAITDRGVATVVPDPPVTPLFHVLLPVDAKTALAARSVRTRWSLLRKKSLS